jgi:hypothetical protein
MMPDREEFNVGGITDSMPNNAFRIFVLEPTVIRLVPTKVRVDDVTHGADIAPTGFVSGADY